MTPIDDRRERRKKLIGAIYSATAGRVYDTIVVKGAFRAFARGMDDLIAEQGRAAVRSAAGGPILDVPVGTAYFTRGVARQHAGIVVGADLAEGMVREAKSGAAAEGITNLALVQADAHHLPFPDGAFPAIMCTNGIQVMPGLDETLAELTRVLHPQGSLFLSTLTFPLGAALDPQRAERLPTVLKSDRELSRALERAGLRVAARRRSRFALLYTLEKDG